MFSKANQLANEDKPNRVVRLTNQKAPSGSHAAEALLNNAEECRSTRYSCSETVSRICKPCLSEVIPALVAPNIKAHIGLEWPLSMRLTPSRQPLWAGIWRYLVIRPRIIALHRDAYQIDFCILTKS